MKRATMQLAAIIVMTLAIMGVGRIFVVGIPNGVELQQSMRITIESTQISAIDSNSFEVRQVFRIE